MYCSGAGDRGVNGLGFVQNNKFQPSHDFFLNLTHNFYVRNYDLIILDMVEISILTSLFFNSEISWIY